MAAVICGGSPGVGALATRRALAGGALPPSAAGCERGLQEPSLREARVPVIGHDDVVVDGNAHDLARLDELAPERVDVPSGSSVRVAFRVLPDADTTVYDPIRPSQVARPVITTSGHVIVWVVGVVLSGGSHVGYRSIPRRLSVTLASVR